MNLFPFRLSKPALILFTFSIFLQSFYSYDLSLPLAWLLLLPFIFSSLLYGNQKTIIYKVVSVFVLYAFAISVYHYLSSPSLGISYFLRWPIGYLLIIAISNLNIRSLEKSLAFSSCFSLILFLVQTFMFYVFSYKLDYLELLHIESSRMDSFASGFFRPSGIFVEPGTYSAVTICAAACLIILQGFRCSSLVYLLLVSCIISLSAVGIISSSILLLALLLANLSSLSKYQKYIFLLPILAIFSAALTSSLASTFLFSRFDTNLPIADNLSLFSKLNVLEYSRSNLTPYSLLFGNIPANISDHAYYDVGAAISTLYQFGIVGFTLQLLSCRTLLIPGHNRMVKLAILLSVSLTKIYAGYIVFWFFIHLASTSNRNIEPTYLNTKKS